MRFALYHPWVYLTGGIERVLLELQRRSRHDWVIYTHHLDRNRTFPELAERVVELAPRVSVRRSLVPLMRAATTIAQTRLPVDGRAGLLVSSEGLGDFVVARNHDEPVAVYCHTPLKIVHDPSTRDALRTTSAHKYALMRVLAPAFVAADRAAWRRYVHAFANSAETRRRIAAAGLRDADDVEVLEPGVDLDRFVASPSRPREGRFVLAGRIMWQKNIELAIDAVRLLAERGIDAPLVVAGTIDDKSSDYADSLRRRAQGLPIEFRIDISDDELASLYASSNVALFTARNEDFGLVPLEAMAAGTPVLAVDAGGPRETVIDGRTGWLRPATAEAFSLEMQRILTSRREVEEMREPARRRAEEFGWQRMVDRIDDVMEQHARVS